jgi:hypothetical protein
MKPRIASLSDVVNKHKETEGQGELLSTWGATRGEQTR